MALVLHELSTNAAKYGALSRPGGALSIKWKFDSGLACELDWEERGGPTVQPPHKLGFGAILIDRSVPFDLGGTSDVQYEPTGLRAKFSIPTRHVSPAHGVATSNKAKPQVTALNPEILLAGTKALIVEDQMLIAMDLEQMLDTIGISEIVTTNSTREALERLGTFNPDIAILDVNLGGETSEAIADELDRRKIPFLFATGYGEQSIIPARFSSKSIVRKPYDTGMVAAQLSQLLGRN
jgi:CheY-like chemotaxis protein